MCKSSEIQYCNLENTTRMLQVSSCEVHYKITFQNILSPIYHRVEGSFKNKNDKPSEVF